LEQSLAKKDKISMGNAGKPSKNNMKGEESLLIIDGITVGRGNFS